MSDGNVGGDADLPAGEFSSWVDDIEVAIRDRRTSAVPCDGCTACCTSSQFVHIRADETDTLAHIPAALLFPAPGLPPGCRLLGYDERGHCPMLVDGRCSIYEHRPAACRTYDCRVFPAADVEAGDGDQADPQAVRAEIRHRTERTLQDRARRKTKRR
jgi:Fe-S-cluster containining protein